MITTRTVFAYSSLLVAIKYLQQSLTSETQKSTMLKTKNVSPVVQSSAIELP